MTLKLLNTFIIRHISFYLSSYPIVGIPCMLSIFYDVGEIQTMAETLWVIKKKERKFKTIFFTKSIAQSTLIYGNAKQSIFLFLLLFN